MYEEIKQNLTTVMCETFNVFNRTWIHNENEQKKNIENKRNWKIVVREGIADFEIFNVEQY